MYTGPAEEYRWDDDSYAALAAQGVRWQAVTYVLRYAHPRVRHHLGALLRIAGYDRDGGLLGVTLIEEADDQDLVVSARYLEGAEREAVEKLLSGGKR